MSSLGTLYNPTRYDMNESFGYQLLCVTMLMRREIESRMAEHGLTDSQWKPLWMIKAGRAGTVAEIARRLDMDAGAVTRLVDRLVAKGLIRRERSESDRRVVHLRLTPIGEAAIAEAPNVLAAVNNDFLRGFTEHEFKRFRRYVSRLSENGTTLQRGESHRS